MANAIRAIYQGCYKGGVIHADNGNKKPLCYDRNYWENDRSPTRWETSKDKISCKHCRKKLAESGELSVKKLTFRERLLSNG